MPSSAAHPRTGPVTIVIDISLRQTMPGVGWMHGFADIAGSRCTHGAFAVLIVISSNQIETTESPREAKTLERGKQTRENEDQTSSKRWNRRNIKEEAKKALGIRMHVPVSEPASEPQLEIKYFLNTDPMRVQELMQDFLCYELEGTEEQMYFKALDVFIQIPDQYE